MLPNRIDKASPMKKLRNSMGRTAMRAYQASGIFPDTDPRPGRVVVDHASTSPLTTDSASNSSLTAKKKTPRTPHPASRHAPLVRHVYTQEVLSVDVSLVAHLFTIVLN